LVLIGGVIKVKDTLKRKISLSGASVTLAPVRAGFSTRNKRLMIFFVNYGTDGESALRETFREFEKTLVLKISSYAQCRRTVSVLRILAHLLTALSCAPSKQAKEPRASKRKSRELLLFKGTNNN
jgi:hypothetical protein